MRRPTTRSCRATDTAAGARCSCPRICAACACWTWDAATARARASWPIGVDPSAACVARAEASAAKRRAEGAAWAGRLAFARGCFEGLRAAGVEDASFDVVIVNSVLNLAWDLEEALREAARALAPGGFLYHAGVFADEPLPPAAMQAFARAGNVFGAARSQGEFARIAVDRAGFSSCSFERERTVEPDGSDAAEELRGRSFTAAIACARR